MDWKLLKAALQWTINYRFFDVLLPDEPGLGEDGAFFFFDFLIGAARVVLLVGGGASGETDCFERRKCCFRILNAKNQNQTCTFFDALENLILNFTKTFGPQNCLSNRLRLTSFWSVVSRIVTSANGTAGRCVFIDFR